MNRALISLYVLLTSRIPVPWTLMAKGAAVVLTYALALPFETTLTAFGLSALGLSLLIGLLTVFSRNVMSGLRQIAPSDLTSTVLGTLFVIGISISAAILWAPSARWLQHAISLGWAFYGALYALFLIFDRSMLGGFNWVARDWETGQGNAARWYILRCFGLAVANEAAIAHFSLTEWVVTHAALPIVFHALFYWSIYATHPYEDDA